MSIEIIRTIFAFVLVLGVLIFFHEFGHFIVAKLFGVGVEKFSLGFGPRLIGKTIGGTDYRLSAIPLGGYVKMVGEEPDVEISPEDIPFSFTHKPLLQRTLIVAAGPLFNIFLAFIIFFGFNLSSGPFVWDPCVGKVMPDTPAAQSGIQEGDRIIDIEGISIETWEDMSETIAASNGKELNIVVLRDDEIHVFNIKPQVQTTKNLFGEDVHRYLIGISRSWDGYSYDLTIIQAFSETMSQTWEVTKLTVVVLGKVVQGVISPKTIGGPIMIAQMAGEQAREGAGRLILFIAVISINLAVLNFLPIPILDGGHLLFFLIEAIMGRPANARVREIAQQAGMFLLLLLMIFVFYNDISRVFFS